MLRRLLSAAIALPVLFAAATFAGPRSGLFSERFGVWLFASAVAVTLVVVLWRVAVALERAGDQRSQFEGMMLALAQTASGGIVGADRDGQIVCANAAMFACEHGALDGQASEVVFCGADRGREHERLDRLLAGGERSTAVWVAAMSRCSLG